MTRIVRCPACGALWKCPDEAAETLRCGECRHTFVLARAETVEVDDDALARVVAARRAPEEKKEAQMAKIAEDLSDFHARETPEPAVPVRAAPPEKKPRKGGALFALLGLVGLAGALTAGALYFHDPILRQFPPLRGVYENICRTLPCPGFAWSDVRAFEIRGELTEAESPRRVRIEITNASDRPQILPLLEVRLLGSADETLAQRLFEPADYGFAEENVLPAGETVRVEAELEVDAALPVRGVRVTAVTPI